MDLYMPANSKAYFDFLVDIGEFDLIEKEPFYEFIFETASVFDPD